MDAFVLQEDVERLVTPFLEDRGVELVELTLAGGQRRKILRFFVDRSGGITIGECTALSRDLADLLDTHDPIGGTYVLEVSSPGLNRPLKTERDYQRSVGKAVRLQVDGKEALVGILTSCGSENLTLEMETEVVQIPRCSIRKANLHFEI
jgi:ribosome maturation factor RimP